MSLLRFVLAVVPFVAAIHAMPSANSPLDKRSVTCLTVGATATATWTDSSGQTCTYSAVVGNNFGENAAGGEYVHSKTNPTYSLGTSCRTQLNIEALANCPVFSAIPARAAAEPDAQALRWAMCTPRTASLTISAPTLRTHPVAQGKSPIPPHHWALLRFLLLTKVVKAMQTAVTHMMLLSMISSMATPTGARRQTLPCLPLPPPTRRFARNNFDDAAGTASKEVVTWAEPALPLNCTRGEGELLERIGRWHKIVKQFSKQSQTLAHIDKSIYSREKRSAFPPTIPRCRQTVQSWPPHPQHLPPIRHFRPPKACHEARRARYSPRSSPVRTPPSFRPPKGHNRRSRFPLNPTSQRRAPWS